MFNLVRYLHLNPFSALCKHVRSSSGNYYTYLLIYFILTAVIPTRLTVTKRIKRNKPAVYLVPYQRAAHGSSDLIRDALTKPYRYTSVP